MASWKTMGEEDFTRGRSRTALHWLWDQRAAMLVVMLSRLGLLVLVYLSLLFLPIKQGDGLWQGFPNNRFLDGWSRWDAAWYAQIAKNGYSNVPQPQTNQRDTTFWPLYPLVVRLVNSLIGNIHLSGLVVSNTSFLVACLLLYDLVKRRLGEQVAFRTIVLIAVYPYSFYFSAFYSESLYLLCVVSAFYSAENENWCGAGIWAAAAGATRAVGCLCVPALFLLYLERRAFNWRQVRLDVLWVLLGLLGPLSSWLTSDCSSASRWCFTGEEMCPAGLRRLA